MAKPDFPALLTPGVHNLTLADIKQLAVDPFPDDLRRARLYQGLVRWTGALNACGVRGTLWLDGSFLTEKSAPDDVDCVLWNPDWISVSTTTKDALRRVEKLLDKQEARSGYGLDVYVEVPDVSEQVQRQEYWRGFFGCCHDQVTAKGLAEVQI